VYYYTIGQSMTGIEIISLVQILIFGKFERLV